MEKRREHRGQREQVRSPRMDCDVIRDGEEDSTLRVSLDAIRIFNIAEFCLKSRQKRLDPNRQIER